MLVFWFKIFIALFDSTPFVAPFDDECFSNSDDALLFKSAGPKGIASIELKNFRKPMSGKVL